MHSSIYSSLKNGMFPIELYWRSIISDLRRLQLIYSDIIIIAVDSKNSWRREYDTLYKSNRKELREKQSNIDWQKQFDTFQTFLLKLHTSTPFNIISIDKMEADDIMAFTPLYFKEQDIILCSTDSDIDMLTAYNNVTIYSPKSKRFKKIANPYKVLEEKIAYEKTDNLISPILSEADENRRRKIIDLIHLPEEILLILKQKFDNINFNKEYKDEFLSEAKIRDLYSVYTNYKEFNKKRKKKYTQLTLL